MCVGVTGSGQVLTAANVLGGDWRADRVDGYDSFTGVSCPKASLCFAVDDAGRLLSSNDPGGGMGAWRAARIDPQAALVAVACPAASLCVALDEKGSVLSSTDPTGGAAAWHRAEIDPNLNQHEVLGVPQESLACPSSSFCIAVFSTQSGGVYTSTQPTGGAAAWRQAAIGGETVACASASLCVIGDGEDVLSSTDPGGGAGAWHAVIVGDGTEGGGITGSSCPSAHLCVVTGTALFDNGGISGEIFTSTDPAASAPNWKLQLSREEHSVECGSVSLCFAFGNPVYTSTDPTGGPDAWRPSTPDKRAAPTAISCQPNTNTCVAVDASGNILTSH
jgi:hypothetical protein